MTVSELRKKLRELNPDAVVMIGKKDGLQGIYNIGYVLFHCPNDINDPWRADIVAIFHEEGEEEDDSTGTP